MLSSKYKSLETSDWQPKLLDKVHLGMLTFLARPVERHQNGMQVGIRWGSLGSDHEVLGSLQPSVWTISVIGVEDIHAERLDFVVPAVGAALC